MDEGCISVWSTRQTNRKKMQVMGRFQVITKIKFVCLWKCSDK